jgi:hypothetical protein
MFSVSSDQSPEILILERHWGDSSGVSALLDHIVFSHNHLMILVRLAYPIVESTGESFTLHQLVGKGL